MEAGSLVVRMIVAVEAIAEVELAWDLNWAKHCYYHLHGADSAGGYDTGAEP